MPALGLRFHYGHPFYFDVHPSEPPLRSCLIMLRRAPSAGDDLWMKTIQQSHALKLLKGALMRYQISGKQLDIGESLQTHVKQELNEIVAKYAERPTEAIVTFSKDRHEFVCESSVHLSTGLTVNAKAHATEIYDSFDSCGEKMEKQLRRYKRRLKDHHSQRTTPVETFGAPSYILAQEDAGEDASEPDTLQPIIVAETQTKIKSLSVGEAVMQMELAGENVLVFQNEGQKRVNVVYKRSDGNIGWIDPE